MESSDGKRWPGDLELSFADIIILLYCVIICFMWCLFCCNAMLRCGFRFSVSQNLFWARSQKKRVSVCGGCFVYHRKWKWKLLPIQMNIFPTPFFDVVFLFFPRCSGISLCEWSLSGHCWSFLPCPPSLGSPSQPCLPWDPLNRTLTHWTGPWPPWTGPWPSQKDPDPAEQDLVPPEQDPDPLNSTLTHWTCLWSPEQDPDPLNRTLPCSALAPALSLLAMAGCCCWTWPRSADKSSRINQSRLFRTVSRRVLSSSRQGAPQGLWETSSNVRSLTGKVFPSSCKNVLYCSFCSLPFVPSLGPTAQSIAPSSFLPLIRHLCLLLCRLYSPGSLILSLLATCSNPSHVGSYSSWALFLQHCSCASPYLLAGLFLSRAELCWASRGSPACSPACQGSSAQQHNPLSYHPPCLPSSIPSSNCPGPFAGDCRGMDQCHSGWGSVAVPSCADSWREPQAAKLPGTVMANGSSVQMLDENRNILAEKCLVAVLEDE